MSIKGSQGQIIESLQRVTDQLEDELCCPTTLLRTLDYGLLTHGDVSIRKAALLLLFILVRASMVKPQQGKPSYKLKAPLKIKNNVIYLAVTSDDEGLAKFHISLKATTKLRPDFLGKNLFGFHQINSNSCSMLGVETIKKGKHLVLADCLDFIPDPTTCRIFCKSTPCWQTAVGLEYMRVGGGPEEVPTCSSSSRPSSLDSCLSLDSLDTDLRKLPVKLKGHMISRRKNTQEFVMDNPQTKSKFEENKFMTTGHFERAEMQPEYNMSNLEQSVCTLRSKRKEPNFIIRHKNRR